MAWKENTMETHLEGLGVGGRIVLKFIFKEKDSMARNK